MKRIVLAALMFAASMAPITASASSITFGFTSGSASATALFQNSGANLVVTLTNTSGADVEVPIDVLTAVFFNVAASPVLTPLSANICATCAIVETGGSIPSPATDPEPFGVGGEWAYKNGAGLPGGAAYGISSTGLGLFGAGDRFPGIDLDEQAAPAGLSYGITSAGDDMATGNGGVSGRPLIKNQVIFTLSGFGEIDPFQAITNVAFQYGTSTTEPRYTGTCVVNCDRITITENPVPEPASLILVGSSLLGVVAKRRRARKASREQ